MDGSASRKLVCCSVHVRVKNFLKMHRLKQMAMHQIALQLPKEMQEASQVSQGDSEVIGGFWMGKAWRVVFAC